MIYQAKLKELKPVASDATEAVFHLEQSGFSFVSGQYIRIILGDSGGGLHGQYRDFSLSSDPHGAEEKNILSVSFRNSDSAFKKTLLTAPLGTLVRISGPFGIFTPPTVSDRPLFFIAGGMGISPFLSMLRKITRENIPCQITLLYANRSESSAAHIAEIKEIFSKREHTSLKLIYGLLDEEELRKDIDASSANAPIYFVAGPPEMVSVVGKSLVRIGVSPDNIRTEAFTGSMIGNVVTGASPTEGSRTKAVLEALNKTALVSETDLDGTITYANDKFIEISKYSRDELLGQNHRILRSGYHPEAFYKELWETITSGKVFRGEIKNRAKDGTFYWVDSSVAPIFGKDKNIVGYLAIRFPITEKKDAEERALSEFAHIEKLNSDFERMNAFMVGRELKMVELKSRIAELEKRNGSRTGNADAFGNNAGGGPTASAQNP